jgi:two-component system, cell cycle response regulator DivK
MNGRTVLVVEDSPDERIIYSAVLKYFGFDVLEAEDGSEGVRLAREVKPDLVLMDIMLPVVSGLTATEILKLSEQTATIPVIAISAYDVPPEQIAQVGCDGFMSKPLTPSHILSEIRRFLPELPGLEAGARPVPLSAPVAAGVPLPKRPEEGEPPVH